MDKYDDTVLPEAEVKQNGIPFGITNKAGVVYLQTLNCINVKLSAEKLPLYKEVSIDKITNFSEVVSIKLDAIRVSWNLQKLVKSSRYRGIRNDSRIVVGI